MSPKSFKDSPTFNFISESKNEASPEEATQPEEKKELKEPEEVVVPSLENIPEPPEGYKKNYLYIEKKSRRLNLLMQPSLYKKIKSAADENGLSVNEFINQTLRKSLSQ